MLNRCIATDTGSFATRYWGCLPLLSRAATLPQDFSDLLSEAAVDELISERGVRAPFIRMAAHGDLLARDCYLGPAGFGAEMPDQVDSAKVLAQFAGGATIVLQGLHRLWPPLIEFVRSMVDDIGHPVQANAYVTPPNNRGFDPHYDVHDVFVLQAAGHKRWIVHAPVHADPLPSQPWTDHRAAIADRVADDAVIDAVLGPGDSLYLPRGWIHSAQALEATSIHLTLGVSPVTGVDVARAVVDALATLEEFRASLPMGIDASDRGAMAAVASKIMAEVAETMRHRTAEITDDAAARLARRHAERTRPVPVRPLATLVAAAHAETTAVVWRRGLVAEVDHRDDRVVLRLPDRTITFPTSCGPAVDALRHGLVADARSTPGLVPADAAVLIRRLLREAVVVPTDSRGQSTP
ncbi:MAG: bifunctional lysine-specific demethylase and histidyl-hydroxylase [Mycobacterium sp.]|nr:bifunctional lysine-specific demethylase and histidyl-hydroxylase [Mycobacterium sp.]